MKNRLISLFLNLVLFLSFNLGTFEHAHAQLGGAMFEKLGECEKNQGEGDSYIFRPECGFDHKKTELTDMKPTIYSRVMSTLFAFVGMSVIRPQYLSGAQLECPTNKTAVATIATVAASSLAALGGEIFANLKYRQIGQTAATLAVGEEGQKKAFENLLFLYENMKKTLITKTTIASAAEAGYLTAEGLELAGIGKCKKMCKDTNLAADTRFKMLKKTIAELVGKTTVQRNSLTAKNQNGQWTVSIGQCAVLINELEHYGESIDILYKKQKAMSEKRLAYNKAASNYYAPLLLAFSQPRDFGMPLYSKLDEKNKSDMDKASKELISSDKAFLEIKNLFTTLESAIVPLEKGCFVEGTALLPSAELKKYEKLALGENDGLRVACCGTEISTASGDPKKNNFIYKSVLNSTPNARNTKDVYFPRIKLFNSKGEQALYFKETIKKVVYNVIFEQMMSHGDLKSLHNINNMVEELFKEKSFYDDLAIMLDNILMNKAYAEEKPELQKLKFMDYVGGLASSGIGASFVKILEKKAETYKDILAATPSRRSITFSLMAGFNTVSLASDANNLSVLTKRIRAINDVIDNLPDGPPNNAPEGGRGSGANLITRQQPVGKRGGGEKDTCLVPTGSGYAFTKNCPTKFPEAKASIPGVDPNLRSQLGAAYFDTISALPGVASGAASGSLNWDSYATAGMSETWQKRSQAMKKRNKELREMVDKMDAEGSPKGQKKNLGFASFHNEMMKNLTAPFGGKLSGLPAVEKGDESSVSDEGESSISKKEVQENYNSPSSGFGLGMDDDEKQDLNFDTAMNENKINIEEFDVDQNDISNNSDASIFKILSNRYLMSYPKVLEEK